jgi:hypothetical protein
LRIEAALQEEKMKAVVMILGKLTPDWPPSVVEGRQEVSYPIRWDQALANGRVFVDEEYVRFYAKYEGQLLLCSFQTPDLKTSVKMAKVLQENQGKSVQLIGTIEIAKE